MRLARRGDRDAIDRILQRNADRLERLARDRLGDGLRARVQTSDVLQSTYLDVLRCIGDFKGENEEDFTAWVVRVLENNIRDKGRFFGRAKRKGERPSSEKVGHPDPHPGPRSQAELVDDLRHVRLALDQLSPDHRRVVEMKMIEDRTHEEIAAELGRTEVATRALLTRARAALLVEIERLRSGDSE